MANPSRLWDDFFGPSNVYTGPRLTDVMVAGVETTLGYRLPQSYLRLLRVKNGGVPKRPCYPTAGTTWSDNHVCLTTLCGIGGRWGIDSEELGSRHAISQAGFPEVGIFFGWTPTAGHDGFMLDYSECGPQGEPRVIFVDPEEIDGGVQVLAPDFETFLQRLTDCRPYDEATKRAMDEYSKRMQGKT
ncbi:MAG: SMI1/KNR4 family protein [Planctomycetaceae bacterium]|nr:SMI1/KNR4 family protein [Planctomycetaceae bacterium]